MEGFWDECLGVLVTSGDSCESSVVGFDVWLVGVDVGVDLVELPIPQKPPLLVISALEIDLVVSSPAVLGLLKKSRLLESPPKKFQKLIFLPN